MNTRKIASEYRLAHWSGLLQERIQSGQSIDGFCTATGISRNTYFYWQRKLRETAQTDIKLLGSICQMLKTL